MQIEDVCKLIEACFELSPGSVTLDAGSQDVSDWDSLGHFALLEFIETNHEGALDRFPGLAQASSVKDLYEMGLKNI
jgi:hypothetical protein